MFVGYWNFSGIFLEVALIWPGPKISHASSPFAPPPPPPPLPPDTTVAERSACFQLYFVDKAHDPDQPYKVRHLPVLLPRPTSLANTGLTLEVLWCRFSDKTNKTDRIPCGCRSGPGKGFCFSHTHPLTGSWGLGYRTTSRHF